MTEIDTEKKQIEFICQDMAQGNWKEYWSEGAFLIRPSGNPLSADQELQMRTNQDLKMIKEELVKINRVSVYGEIATCCFTVHQVFSYKETPNDDISVVLVVLKREDGSWKMVSGSRSQGRSPSEPPPKFD